MAVAKDRGLSAPAAPLTAGAKETQRRAKKAARGADKESDTPLLDGVEETEVSDG